MPFFHPGSQRPRKQNAAGPSMISLSHGRVHVSMLLLAASLILYTAANFSGTEKHVASFLLNNTSGWSAGTTRARVLIKGVTDTSTGPTPAKAITHTSGCIRAHAATVAAAAAAAVAAAAATPTPSAGQATVKHQLPSSLSKTQQVWELRHAVTAAHEQQPTTPENITKSQPLPWRALHHLDAAYKHGDASSTQAPAYLVSAFLDTRPIIHSQPATIAVIMAVDKRRTSQEWKCLLRVSAGSAHFETLNFTVTYSVPNNEAFFNYQASTGTCELPQALQDLLLPNDNLHESRTQPSVTMTVIRRNDWGEPFYEALLNKSRIWVPLEIIPKLSTQQRQQYMSGAGSFAVCTPPVHTDAYAATLVGWQAFHKQMGVQRVVMYSFNPGPLIKPLMDFYAAEGSAQVHEWIIPSSILEHKQQDCLLPFFHPSKARLEFDSPRCTYHQDNYAIAHWGQTLAIQDCVYRTMAAKHRWVAVVDLDEYILPQAAENWHAMLQQLVNSNNGNVAAEYAFAGVKLCSGCLQQQQQQQPLQFANSTHPGACQVPVTIGFHHITWPSTLLAAASVSGRDYQKTIVDPLAVGQGYVHSIANLSPHSLATGRTAVPLQMAVKMHDRVHDIHKGNTTFAAHMLPLLKANIKRVAAATAAGRFDQTVLPLWPSPGSACDMCGSVSTAELASPLVPQDLAFCRLFGQRLLTQISADVAAMEKVGLFSEPSAWGSTNPAMANLYGGHSFTAWAPP